MPFAGYKDFADCVARNRDKRDPDAYCAAIMRAAEGDKPTHPDNVKRRRRFAGFWKGHL